MVATIQSSLHTSPSVEDLKPCPFCGDKPTFSDIKDPDERRYMMMELECCVTMRTSISYPDYNKLPGEALANVLKHQLVAQWNARTEV